MPFIALEGIDGAGKSELARGLAAALKAAGRDVVPFREPGSTPVGERVRALLLDPALGRIEPLTEALLFSACRAEMVRTQIAPALAAGKWVLLDRYRYSTEAYQGGGGGADPRALRDIGRAATGGLAPDLVLLLDLPPEVAARRRGRVADRIEAQDPDYYARVRAAYLAAARDAEPPTVFRVLDATPAAPVVLAAALAAVDARFPLPRGVV
jgi:dTMP kinase